MLVLIFPLKRQPRNKASSSCVLYTKGIHTTQQWDKKISAADIQYTKKRERIKEEQDSLYEKYEALLNATKLLEEEVTTLFDELLLDDLEKVFDLDYFIDIGDNADAKETEKLNP